MATVGVLLWVLAYQLNRYTDRRRYAGRHHAGPTVGATIRIAALRPARATLAAWHCQAPVMTRAAMLRAV